MGHEDAHETCYALHGLMGLLIPLLGAVCPSEMSSICGCNEITTVLGLICGPALQANTGTCRPLRLSMIEAQRFFAELMP